VWSTFVTRIKPEQTDHRQLLLGTAVALFPSGLGFGFAAVFNFHIRTAFSVVWVSWSTAPHPSLFSIFAVDATWHVMNNPAIKPIYPGRQGIHIRINTRRHTFPFDSYTVLRILTICARSNSCPIDRVRAPARDWWPNEIFPITRSRWIVSVDPVSPPAFRTSYHLLAVRCQFWSLTEFLWLNTSRVQLSVTASAPAIPILRASGIATFFVAALTAWRIPRRSPAQSIGFGAIHAF